MRRWVSVLCILLLCAAPLCACNAVPQRQQVYYDLFDTVTVIVGYERSAETFAATAQRIHDLLLEYHRLYDIYYAYDGLTNLHTVNRCAANGPVAVDTRIMALLQFGMQMHAASGGAVNIAMGSVLRLWHDCRTAALTHPEDAAIPTAAALQQAAMHCSMDDLLLDAAAGTVTFADPALQLDVGAIAKGYALEQVCLQLMEEGVNGYSVSLGGNVRTVGTRADGQDWLLAVQNPDASADFYACRLLLDAGALVTSGSYQRYFTVAGVDYHHIIDPETLMPGARYRSVTILCGDSGLADALSTALFNLSPAQGEALLAAYPGAQAMWIETDGTYYSTPGFLARCTQWMGEDLEES